MTPEQIIKWAREAGFKMGGGLLSFQQELTRFAKLVAIHERESQAARLAEWVNYHLQNAASVSVESAIKAEREACAKIVDGIHGKSSVASATIRSREMK